MPIDRCFAISSACVLSGAPLPPPLLAAAHGLQHLSFGIHILPDVIGLRSTRFAARPVAAALALPSLAMPCSRLAVAKSWRQLLQTAAAAPKGKHRRVPARRPFNAAVCACETADGGGFDRLDERAQLRVDVGYHHLAYLQSRLASLQQQHN